MSRQLIAFKAGIVFSDAFSSQSTLSQKSKHFRNFSGRIHPRLEKIGIVRRIRPGGWGSGSAPPPTPATNG